MSSSATALPPLSHVLETCLYVRDLEKSARFYREALNIEPFMQSVSLIINTYHPDASIHCLSLMVFSNEWPASLLGQQLSLFSSWG